MNAKYLLAALATFAVPALTLAQTAPAAQSAPGAQAVVGAAAASVQAATGRHVHICQNEAECDAAPQRDFTVTRAQVLAELYRARAAGEIPENEADNDGAGLRSHAK